PTNSCSCSKKGKACRFTDFPQQVDVVEKCEPIYEELDGWSGNTKGAENYKDLPKQAKAYIKYISDKLGVKIDLISTGQKRNEIIFVNNPFGKAKGKT
ncbi:MAG TPA: hypothetical protein ENH18_03145, partial [Nitrospirae bacterium]|nr:hypothetical protein [Nitrospirota bacterium]HEW81346.1 hypothetical protein [Nitrospirota bacterium]